MDGVGFAIKKKCLLLDWKMINQCSLIILNKLTTMVSYYFISLGQVVDLS